MGNVSFKKKKSLPVIGSSECFLSLHSLPPPTRTQKVSKYMIASGKQGTEEVRNQVLAVFPFSFVCEFLKYKCGDIKHSQVKMFQ